MDIASLDDGKLGRLIDSKWKSSEEVFEVVRQAYERNSLYYGSDDGKDRKTMPPHLWKVGTQSHRVRSNRIFRDAESVINALIANPPKPNVVPARPGAEEAARLKEKFLLKLFEAVDMKSKLRRGLRFLYKSRLVVLKPHWDAAANDVALEVIDPRKIRVPKRATCEKESDFVIEEVETTVQGLLAKYPDKKELILKTAGIDAEEAAIEDRDATYKEAWIGDWLCVKWQGVILERRRNPYWDWDGVLLNGDERVRMAEERKAVLGAAQEQEDVRRPLYEAKASGMPAPEGVDLNAVDLEPYFFNHFDSPRKPYVFATVLNDEKRPIGKTDFIAQAIPLQEALDRRKRQIDENALFVNGITKVDSSVMSREEAEKLRYDTSGLIHGKGVVAGVARETGTPLPSFVFEDLQDSRNEIDNIMGATSAFRGEREGQETKAGRLALIEQSFLNLNELVQVTDYLCRETFNWFYQLMKMNYTERHYAKSLGAEGAAEVIELVRDDIEDGEEVSVVPGKTLPEDRAFRYERAQADKDVLAPGDYFREAGYDDPKSLVANVQEAQAPPQAAPQGLPPPEQLAAMAEQAL